jgi:hypothetical protein
MMEKIMTHGMELDEVDGPKRNVATTILDDADLEVVSGGIKIYNMNDFHMWAAESFAAGALAGVVGHRR